MRYLLDSNIFIQSANLEYRHRFCANFWKLLVELHHQGLVYSIQAVEKEINNKKDDLSAWIAQLPQGFFLDELQAQLEYANIIGWSVGEAQYTDAAKNEFAQGNKAYAWLVALAKREGMGIITHETYDPNIKKRIKIPNACRAAGVTVVPFYPFLASIAQGNFDINHNGVTDHLQQ